MQIKTFEGLNITDAMKSVKKNLGPDAVILSTKEKNNGKIKTFEVKAAAPHGKNEIPDTLKTIEDEKIQYRLDRIEYLNEKILEKSNNDFSFEKMFDHLREIKLILSSNSFQKENEKFEFDENFSNIFQSLKMNGVQKEFLFDLTKYLKDFSSKDSLELKNFNSQEDFYKSQSISWMLKKIKVHSFGKSSIHIFVGNTGCGKTTVVQKLASIYKQKQIPFIVLSYDNIKIGGHESMKIYSKILGADCFHCETIKDLHNIILEKRNYAILIDTVGFNPKTFSEIQEIQSIKNIDIPIETHLVLSLLEKSHELDRSVNYFGKIGLDSLIFTKLDGALAYGDIFNIGARWSLPLSFFSTSQKVPDGFEKATKERVIEKIFCL